jgi:hypothetical protein
MLAHWRRDKMIVIKNGLIKTLDDFVSANQKIADKYGATIEIGIPGQMVTIAKPKKMSGGKNDQ